MRGGAQLGALEHGEQAAGEAFFLEAGRGDDGGPVELLGEGELLEQRFLFALVALGEAQLPQRDHLAALEVVGERLQHLAQAAVRQHPGVHSEGGVRLEARALEAGELVFDQLVEVGEEAFWRGRVRAGVGHGEHRAHAEDLQGLQVLIRQRGGVDAGVEHGGGD